jgi:hypothetical protein
MIKVWFLIALMSYPNTPAIHYKGFGGFTTQEECEEKKIITENHIADLEIKLGRTVYIDTYCIEFEAFQSQLDKKKELDKKNNIGLGV